MRYPLQFVLYGILFNPSQKKSAGSTAVRFQENDAPGTNVHYLSFDLTNHVHAIHPQPLVPIPMHYPDLKQQIDRIINSYSRGGEFARLINPAWEIFDAFIASQHAADLKSLDEIPTSLLAPFVAHCEASQMPDSQLFMVLAALRTLLVLSGRDQRDLAGLVAPRKRKRVKNADGGTYQFEYFPKVAGAIPENVAADTGNTRNSANDEPH
ncbi:hypothetical protein [Paraburkholderia sediminicola]|uniref:hypothetical protein n=1 Tax=Paraburkholderia sediminicola TaxID=458836 RepID=UPI0038B94500